MNQNPYQTPVELDTQEISLAGQAWGLQGRSTLLEDGLLRRRIRIVDPVDCLLEYRADRLNDQISIDGKVLISKLPVLWLYEKFEFNYQHDGVVYPFKVLLKIGRLLRIHKFEVWVNDDLVYQELMGKVVDRQSGDSVDLQNEKLDRSESLDRPSTVPDNTPAES